MADNRLLWPATRPSLLEQAGKVLAFVIFLAMLLGMAAVILSGIAWLLLLMWT